ncbi:MAG: fibronectin type III domain-containing protein [Prolixibacteraceae bacterium]
MSKYGILLLTLFLALEVTGADKAKRLYAKAKEASVQFAKDASVGKVYKFKVDTLKMDAKGLSLKLQMTPTFAEIPFRPEDVQKYYADYKHVLGRKFRKSSLTISSMGKEISELVPNYYRFDRLKIDSSRLSVPAKRTAPIVNNVTRNVKFPNGLDARNIALWQSHGWYYENTLDRWEWQRARDFLTVEDIWTLSFVVPYLTPMLENAGATVWLPRERDFGSKEVVVDAEKSSYASEYLEEGSNWQTSEKPGFEMKYPFLLDGENPFQFGHGKSNIAKIQPDALAKYIPDFPESGNYGVYVSYIADDQNVTDAHYTVTHAGGKTSFTVNQTIGGNTWIYLGTFKFEKGKEQGKGMVELSNASTEPGKMVSADAVRFGGGMGNIVRGKADQLKQLYDIREKEGWKTDPAIWMPFASQRPRYQEAARYYLQYAGFPDSLVYSLNRTKVDYSIRGADAASFAKRESGMEDYKDDYMSRGEWVNYLMGAPNGPTKAPLVKGMGIPMDMSMGFHTDAGTTKDSSIIGTLLIYDTTFDKDIFPNGQSKWASRDLADLVQTQVVNDLRLLHKADWTRRGMWNKKYFEAARPKVPAILSELLSHQNFADMYLAQDPRFKFDVCRAYYKGILKFLSVQNGVPYVVQPLPVDHFGMKLEENNLKLTWSPVKDPLEPSAKPASYRVYTRIEDGGFDEGVVTKEPAITMQGLKPGTIYSFKVTAVNDGGESFPSEILACSLPQNDSKPVLIVNGFDRICAPAAFDNGKEAGFRMSEDEGVAYLQNMTYIGEQYDFDRESQWIDDDASGFGSSFADQETRIVPGNSFDYSFVHGESFRNNGLGFISASDELFEEGAYNPTSYSLFDLAFGEEKTTLRMMGFPGRDFTLFTPAMRQVLTKIAGTAGAKILVSGAYVGSDLTLCGDSLAKKFAAEVLHYSHRTAHGSKSGLIYTVNSLKTNLTEQYHYVNNWNPSIYKVESPDAIEPEGKGASVLYRYFGDNKSAGVWYKGLYQTAVLSVPLETISTDSERDALMKQLLRILDLK